MTGRMVAAIRATQGTPKRLSWTKVWGSSRSCAMTYSSATMPPMAVFTADRSSKAKTQPTTLPNHGPTKISPMNRSISSRCAAS